MIIESVWGFDLNPLAVQVSRTNFLMAIADLLKDAPGNGSNSSPACGCCLLSGAAPDSEESWLSIKSAARLPTSRFCFQLSLPSIGQNSIKSLRLWATRRRRC